MRNLKRVLSLAMASAMLMGMMVIGAGAADKTYADLTDKDKIQNKEAVSLLVDLGIVQGTDKGTYDPSATVDRATMAKFITYLMMGNVDQNSFIGTATPLSDISGNWAEGFIKYCYSNGIVAGDNTGKYNPSTPVTVVEAAKMLNVALGYDPDKQGYTGNANWSTNIMSNAATSGITSGVSIKATDPLDRDTAALMMYNALFAKEVYYVELAGSSPMYKTSWMGLTQYGLVKAEGTITGISNGKTNMAFDAVTNKDSYDVFNSSKSFDRAASPFDIGKTGTIYVTVKTTTGAGGNWLTNTTVATSDITKTLSSEVVVKDTTLGTVVDGTNLSKLTDSTSDKYIATLDDAVAYRFLGYSLPSSPKNSQGDTPNAGQIDTWSTPAAQANGFYYWDNQMLMKRTYSATASKWNDPAGAGFGMGTQVALLDNDRDGKVDNIVVTRYTPAIVRTLNTSGNGLITFKNEGDALAHPSGEDWTSKNVEGFDDVKKNDVVVGLIYGKTLYLEKTTTVDGKITKTSTNPSKYTIDGTAYTKSDKVAATYNGDANNNTDPKTGDTVTLYLEPNGYVVYVGEVSNADRPFVYVVDTDGKSMGGQNVKVAYTDGTQEILTVTEIDGEDVGTTVSGTKYWLENGGSYSKDTIYYYDETNSGFGLTSVKRADYTATKEDNTTGAKIERGKATIKLNGSTATADNSTLFVDLTNKTVATGYKNAPNVEFSGSGEVLTLVKNAKSGVLVAVYYANGQATANADDKFVIFDSTTVSSVLDGSNTYYEFAAIRNGEITTVVVNQGVKDDIDTYGNAVYTPKNTKVLSDDTEAITSVDTSVDVPVAFVTSGTNVPTATYAKNDTLVVENATYAGSDPVTVTLAGSTTFNLTGDTEYFVVTLDKKAILGDSGDIMPLEVVNTDEVVNAGSQVIVVTKDGEINTHTGTKSADAAYVFVVD